MTMIQQIQEEQIIHELTFWAGAVMTDDSAVTLKGRDDGTLLYNY